MSTEIFLRHVQHCRNCPYQNNPSSQREFIDTCLSRLEFERAFSTSKAGTLYSTSLSNNHRLIENHSTNSHGSNGGTVTSSSSSTTTTNGSNTTTMDDTNSNVFSSSSTNSADINFLSPGSISTIFPSYPTYLSSSLSSSSSKASATSTGIVPSHIRQFIHHTIDQGFLHALPLDTLDPSTPLLISILWLGDEELGIRFLNDTLPNPASLRCTNKEGTTVPWISGCLGMMNIIDIFRTKSINLLSGFVDSIYRHTVLHALSCDESFINSFTTHVGSTVPVLPADHTYRADMIKQIAMELPLLLELRDAKGYTPLEHAMRHGSMNCVLALIAAGAKIPVRYRGETLSYERSLRIFYPDLNYQSGSKDWKSTKGVYNRSNPKGSKPNVLSKRPGGNPSTTPMVDTKNMVLTPTTAVSSESIASVTDDGMDERSNGILMDNDDNNLTNTTTGGTVPDYESSDDEIVHCDNQSEDYAASSVTNPMYYHQWRKTKRAKQRMLKIIEKLALDQGINWSPSINSSNTNGTNNKTGTNTTSTGTNNTFEFSFWGVVRVIILFSTIGIVFLLITLSRKWAIEKAGGLGNIISGTGNTQGTVLTEGGK